MIVDIFLSINPGSDWDFVHEVSKERFSEGNIQVVEDYDQLFRRDEHKILKLLVFSFDDDKLAVEEVKAICDLSPQQMKKAVRERQLWKYLKEMDE